MKGVTKGPEGMEAVEGLEGLKMVEGWGGPVPLVMREPGGPGPGA